MCQKWHFSIATINDIVYNYIYIKGGKTMTTINATEISRDDLEKMAMKILTSHSIADVSRRTAMSYANL